MRFVAIVGAAALSVAACAGTEPATHALDLVLTARGLGPAQLCAPLDSVGILLGDLALGGVHDTTFVGEDESRWRGKTAALSGGGTATFESSWVDSAHIWRITTTAARVRTKHGIAAGDLIARLPAESGPLRPEVPEGQLVLELSGDSVAVLIDSASERVAYGQSDYATHPLHALPKGARISRLVVSRECRVRAPAS